MEVIGEGSGSKTRSISSLAKNTSTLKIENVSHVKMSLMVNTPSSPPVIKLSPSLATRRQLISSDTLVSLKGKSQGKILSIVGGTRRKIYRMRRPLILTTASVRRAWRNTMTKPDDENVITVGTVANSLRQQQQNIDTKE